jgi:NMD protein affecting ribosome stability and mRNA decay
VNKKEAAHIARILRDKYNVKETFKLVGEKKGKKLYRNFYAIR